MQKQSANTQKLLNISLWIAQGLLAVTFIWAAYVKLFTPVATLAAMWPWVGQHPVLVKVTAIFDLLAGLGLILPQLLRIKPVLTIYAAYGTIMLMVSAMAFHIIRGEAEAVGINIFCALIAAFIIWGRSKTQ